MVVTGQTAVRSGPVSSRERAPALDLLRGFALLGILVVNLRFFRGEFSLQGDLGAGSPWWDRVAEGLVTVLAEGRFYPLFSFLLGYGFTVQFRRASASGASIVPRHLRRSAALGLLGLAHAALLFFGDILGAYALLGLALLGAPRLHERALLWWGAALVVFGAVVYGGLNGVSAGLRSQGPDGAAIAADFAADALVYAEGSFWEVAGQRLEEWALGLAFLPFVGGPILAAMLLGHWAARRGVLEDLVTHRALLRRLVVIGAPVGLVGGLPHAFALGQLAGDGGAAVAVLGLTGVVHVLAGAFLTAAYVGAGGLVAARVAGRTRSVQAAGRMALTNYLGQSVVCSLVFYGYGLGAYGELGAALSLVFALALWSVQLVVSRLWFSRSLGGGLVFGPVEWLLRWAAYARRPPMLGRARRSAT